jgi:rod shape-determining protein MreC
MEYSPPPLFKQGASARVKVAFFALMSLGLLFADSRVHALTVIRQAVSTVLYPLQKLALMPRDAVYSASDYFASLSALEQENARLKRQQTLNAQSLQQAQHLFAENAQLRKLLGAGEQLPVKSLLAEILYDARDAFSRRIILNRGTRNGVTPGQPVIDDVGVVGQVTRVSPFTSEVTLLTDKDQAIPVQVVRSGLRSVAYGQGQSGTLDLRFMATNADIRKGDMLVTSGIDGVYPAGLSVATVVKVESKSADAFARIQCQPTAGIDRNRQLLILMVDTNVPPRPEDDAFDRKPGQVRLPENAKGAAPTVPETKAVPTGEAAVKQPAAAAATPTPAPQAAARPDNAAPVAKLAPPAPAATPTPAPTLAPTPAPKAKGAAK